MKRYAFLLALLMACVSVIAQEQDGRSARKYERSGNGQYKQGHYQEAEMDYRRALAADYTDDVARFNLATALIRQQDQNKIAEADSILHDVTRSAERKGDFALSARSLYQMGEIAMMAQQYDKAVAAYKESLKRNPTDNECRFNYLVAKKLLQEQQNQNQNKDDQQKQDQQKQDQQKQQQDQQQQEQQQQEQQQQNQDQQQEQQPQDNQMSEDQRQSILEQNEREEKETQAKVMRRMQDKDNDKKREMEIKRRNGTLKDW